MEMGFGQYQEQRLQLNAEQKQTLKHLTQLSLALRHEGFGEMTKGIEGLKSADALLREKQLHGILIGGLAEAVWNPRHTKKDFDAHKDVDVLIPDLPEETNIGDLENGIDWWLPHDAHLKVNYQSGPTEGNIRFWQNAFNTRLAFGVRIYSLRDISPGLYIPSPEFVTKMRMSEAIAQLDPRTAVPDADIESAFEAKLQKKIKSERAPSIVKEFGDHNPYAFEIVPFDHETIVAINSFGKGEDTDEGEGK